MLEYLALSPAEYAVAATGIFMGTFLQRLSGQAFGMVSAPILAMAAPAYLPATLLFLGIFVGLTSTALDTSQITKSELAPGFSGRALGAVIGAILAMIAVRSSLISLLVAGIVYLGIGLSLVGIRVAIRPVTLFSAGTLAGIMGTLTGIGAPPMALLYQHEETRRAAAMQNAFFFWGMVVSILSLAIAGFVTLRHIAFAGALAPAAVGALFLSQRVAGSFAKRRIRPFALTLAGIAATILVIRTLY